MKKNWILTFLLVSVFCLSSSAIAEEYVSKDFPSNEIVLKNVRELYGQANVQVLGKESNNNSFEVFLMKGGGIFKVTFLRLDTNRWLFKDFSILDLEKRGYYILQK